MQTMPMKLSSSYNGSKIARGICVRVTAIESHREQLADAMQLSERITRLSMYHVQLDKHTLQMIEASVRQKSIIEVDFAFNEFHEGEGVQFAVGILKSNSSVEKFYWTGNSLHSTEDACKLIDAILEHPKISDVNLWGSLSENINPYVPVKRLFGGRGNGTLLEVNLARNSIITNGDRCISDFLSTNPPLEKLHLDRGITDDDALHIALSLQLNTNLRYLGLSGNKLTKKGKSAMYRLSVFGQNQSDLSEVEPVCKANLNAVSGANHTCGIWGISNLNKDFINDGNKSAKSNRARKILWLLEKRQRGGCIISELESTFPEDCIGLVPHVFACINTYSTELSNAYSTNKPWKRCLWLLFELTRGWKTLRVVSGSEVGCSCVV